MHFPTSMIPGIKSRSREEGSLRRVCYASFLAGLATLSGCAEFERHRVLDSGTGVYATEAVPAGGGEWNICLAERPLDTCPRSKAIFHGYRGRDADARWVEPNVLLITQSGGEILKSPPAEAIEVGGQRVAVRLEHTP